MRHEAADVLFALPFVMAIVLNAQPARAADKPIAAHETVVLQRVAVPGTNREMGMGIADFPPNASKPRQRAAGPEVVYVLAGEVTVQAEDQPAKTYHRGESFRIPANVIHKTTAGPAGAKVVATWVWVPGKPFNIRATE